VANELNTVVFRIYTLDFATLAPVESVGGAYMRDVTFYLANTPPLPGPHLDVDIGTLYYRPLKKLVQPQLAFTSLVLQNLMVKID